jgi:hypothetical protein
MRKLAIPTLAALILAGSGAALGGEGGFGDMFRPWPEGQVSRGGLNVRAYTEEDVEDSDEDFSMWGFGVRDTVPLFKRDADEVLFSVSYSNLQVDTGARLPRTPDEAFPEDLHRISLGVTYRHDFGEGRSGALSLRVGSASDELFSDETTIVSVAAVARLPDGNGRNAWILGLGYQNRRSNEDLDHIPLPMLSYQMGLGGRNWAVLGIPFNGVHLETESRIKVDLSYMLLRTVRAKLGYGITEQFDVYGAFAWESERYWRADREDEEDRLAFYEKRLGLGLAYKFSDQFSLGLEGGWSFDRFVYEGEDYDDRRDNWLEIDDAAYARLVLKVSF